ncbi:hypothetical protein BJ741DRAFT_67044 [Chytriomyces cf. hyalinus JEL632]|nr:hypothetical protein BJ741DRAFT_67044 [Chytriomyces cf. hyalinus JEL632]
MGPKRKNETAAKSSETSSKKTKSTPVSQTNNTVSELNVAVPASATAADILKLAQDERRAYLSASSAGKESSEQAAEDARNVSARLFELAIEKVEAEQKLPSAFAMLEKNKLTVSHAPDSGNKVYAPVPGDVAVVYAKALSLLGSLVAVSAFLDLARKVCDEISSDSSEILGDAHLIKAFVALEQLRQLKQLGQSPIDFADMQLGDEDDDEEEEEESESEGEEDAEKEDEQDPEEAEMMVKEVALMQDARAAFIKGIESFASDSNAHTIKKNEAAQQLRNYALLVFNSDKKSPVPTSILTFALSLLDTPYASSSTLIPDQSNADLANSTKASCLYLLARLRARGKDADELGAAQDAKECLRALLLVVGKELNEENEELMGQAFIFLSTVTPNDTLALASFTRGSKILKKALESNPHNAKLKAQLEALGADEADDEGDETLEDEDGNVFDLDAEIDRDDEPSGDDDFGSEDGDTDEEDGPAGEESEDLN